MIAKLRIPLATYRLQFNAQFRFQHARALVDYLDQLGVTDIYASPLLQARRGSLHGYDVTDRDLAKQLLERRFLEEKKEEDEGISHL